MPSVAVVDVSFISLVQVLPAVAAQCRVEGRRASTSVSTAATSANIESFTDAAAPPRAQGESANIDVVVLIKPQFEVGRENVGKGGIVKDERAREAAVERVLACAVSLGFVVRGVRESPVTGADGNVEYVAAFRLGDDDDAG
jgi:predicted rRNA methylase YqxC with S4 and FtsJ domains